MPLLSLAHALKKASANVQIVYIGLKAEKLANELRSRYRIFDKVYVVPAGKFRRYHGESLLAHLVDIRTLWLNAKDFFRFLAGIRTAKRILGAVKPDVVFSKGGFVAVPVGLAARSLKIPIVTHDSDSLPGLSNRIVGRFAQVHATGMPAKHYDYPQESIRYVGIPLDERIKPVTASRQKAFKKQLGLPAESLVLLVGGAGHGARDVNNMVLAIAPKLLERFQKLQIIHIAGQQHQKEVMAKYQAAAPDQLSRLMILGFTADFYKYTGAADLIISRAGATTIAELAAQRKAVILIPAPHLSAGHQLKNAAELTKHQAALVVANDSQPEELLKAVSGILDNASNRRKLADKLGALAKADAADKLAGLLLEVAEKNKNEDTKIN